MESIKQILTTAYVKLTNAIILHLYELYKRKDIFIAINSIYNAAKIRSCYFPIRRVSR